MIADSNAFLLLRHTGMRIGECADLSFDCLRLYRPRRLGHPCAPRQIENRAHGPGGCFRLSAGRSPPSVALSRSPPCRWLSPRPAQWPRRAHPQAAHCLAKHRRHRRDHHANCPAPVATFIRNRDAPRWRHSTRRDEVARTPQSRDDHALSGGLHSWTYSASSIWLAPSPAICYPHHGSLPRPVLPKPTSPVCSIPCMSLSTFWKCSAEPFPKDPIVVSSTASPIDSPRSLQKPENSRKDRSRQRLAS